MALLKDPVRLPDGSQHTDVPDAGEAFKDPADIGSVIFPLTAAESTDSLPGNGIDDHREGCRRQNEQPDPPLEHEQIQGDGRNTQNSVKEVNHVPHDKVHTFLRIGLQHHDDISGGGP